MIIPRQRVRAWVTDFLFTSDADIPDDTDGCSCKWRWLTATDIEHEHDSIVGSPVTLNFNDDTVVGRVVNSWLDDNANNLAVKSWLVELDLDVTADVVALLNDASGAQVTPQHNVTHAVIGGRNRYIKSTIRLGLCRRSLYTGADTLRLNDANDIVAAGDDDDDDDDDQPPQ